MLGRRLQLTMAAMLADACASKRIGWSKQEQESLTGACWRREARIQIKHALSGQTTKAIPLGSGNFTRLSTTSLRARRPVGIGPDADVGTTERSLVQDFGPIFIWQAFRKRQTTSVAELFFSVAPPPFIPLFIIPSPGLLLNPISTDPPKLLEDTLQVQLRQAIGKCC